jgi:hypothetical protein
LNYAESGGLTRRQNIIVTEVAGPNFIFIHEKIVVERSYLSHNVTRDKLQHNQADDLGESKNATHNFRVL